MRLRLAVAACLIGLLAAPLVVAEPGLYSPNVSRGETWSRTITWKDSGGSLVNLTGYAAKLVIKSTPSGTALLTLTESSGLTLGGAAGTIAWEMTAAQTAALPTGSLRYDLLLTSSTGAKTYLVYGFIAVQQRITQ